jgi:hypothetical protein
MYLSEQLQEKWRPILDHPALPEITDQHKRAVTSILLENQENAIMEERSVENGVFLTEASPTSNTQSTGSVPGFSGDATGPVAGYDPIMISLVRRAMPNLMAYDICGVQPMTGPTGLIFAMKSRYTGPGSTDGNTFTPTDEAFHGVEPDTGFSGGGTTDTAANTAAHQGTDPFGTYADGDTLPDGTTFNDSDGVGTPSEGIDAGDPNYQTEGGMNTASAENLGSDSNHFREMGFSLEKTSVIAKSRALKAEYTTELAQDLKAVHGLDAETELSNILSTEILAEINREVIRTVNTCASLGGVDAGSGPTGVFDLSANADGRWSVEKYKGMFFQLERDGNAIAVDTRRGRGNMIICSADVASALSIAGVLDNNPMISNNLSSDVAGNTFAGTLNGKYKVYIDPYFSAAGDVNYYTMGYKGSSAYDAGLFYCPYVPLQMVKAMGEQTFQPKIGFKTRYGMVANPFATDNGSTAVITGNGMNRNANVYYRKVQIKNLLA